MIRLTRTLGSLALAAGVAGAVLVGASPAQATTLTASQTCEPIRYSMFCEASVSGGTAPYTIKWYFNNYYFPQYDNRTYVSWGCSGSNTSKIVVTDAAGGTVTKSSTRTCTGGAP
ncbi:hypothetical protein Lfu02_38740 [Longispora fulva]|uniref:Membrane carboxypeptidase/penicillin-binding protein PbpC n=1 Tax=Longispora fulva TaxID=619741 RepID=A0A8J7GIN5_9ACTN|nr:hypothetical protein [Longispora fulva]MBG6141348.1 membrane carboxypeptidase/penicillin-binding protein PbpC [Longispora fulva]GIG59502.1 hypothetical protein Lfu02_38740 [Longispora fulva]